MADDKKKEAKQGLVGCFAIAVVALGMLYSHCSSSKPSADQRTPEKIAEDSRKADEASIAARVAAAPPPVEQPKWYSGGTLHQATAAEWRAATPANKLATAADFVSKLHESGSLKPRISAKIKDVDDLLAPATQLVIALDKALGDGTPPTTSVATAATM